MMTHKLKSYFKPNKNLTAVGISLCLMLMGSSLMVSSLATEPFKPALTKEPKDQFDRLDGVGPSRINAYFVDWWSQAKQYHLRVKPKNKLIGINAEIDRDKNNKEKDPVLVIEYKFQGLPYTLVRRHSLTSRGLNDGFKIYEDTTSDDDDLIIFTNNTLSDNVREIKYAKPRQKYPDHHEALGEDETESSATAQGKTKTYGNNVPSQEGIRFQKVDHDRRPTKSNTPENTDIDEIDADGGIRPFEF